MGIADLFAALAMSVGNTLKDIGSAGNNVLHGNFAAAGQDAFRLMTADGITKGFKDAFSNFKGRTSPASRRTSERASRRSLTSRWRMPDASVVAQASGTDQTRRPLLIRSRARHHRSDLSRQW
jgi:hypothetical protein